MSGRLMPLTAAKCCSVSAASHTAGASCGTGAHLATSRHRLRLAPIAPSRLPIPIPTLTFTSVAAWPRYRPSRHACCTAAARLNRRCASVMSRVDTRSIGATSVLATAPASPPDTNCRRARCCCTPAATAAGAAVAAAAVGTAAVGAAGGTRAAAVLPLSALLLADLLVGLGRLRRRSGTAVPRETSTVLRAAAAASTTACCTSRARPASGGSCAGVAAAAAAAGSTAPAVMLAAGGALALADRPARRAEEEVTRRRQSRRAAGRASAAAHICPHACGWGACKAVLAFRAANPEGSKTQWRSATSGTATRRTCRVGPAGRPSDHQYPCPMCRPVQQVELHRPRRAQGLWRRAALGSNVQSIAAGRWQA